VGAAALTGLGGPSAAVSQTPVPPTASGSPGTAAQFVQYLHRSFLVSGEGGSAVLTLIDIEHYPRGSRTAGLRTPFSLLFRCWNGGIESGEYVVRLPNGSANVMFLTPVGKHGTLLEAPFN
jgi:hypothetical protein